MLNFYNRLPSRSRVGAIAQTLQRIYIEPANFTKNLHTPILFTVPGHCIIMIQKIIRVITVLLTFVKC